jgi:hypothetical protein
MKYEVKVNQLNKHFSEVVGIVNGNEVIVVSDNIQGVWTVGSSQCLPCNLERASVIAECVVAVFKKVEELK